MLPSFEKFLESPEERRLRRLRAGVITASIGFALSLIMFFAALNKSDFFPFIVPGFITFMVGIGVIINGLLFTVPRKELPGENFNALRYEPPAPTNLTSSRANCNA